jgi:hypothetical protein
VTSRLPPCAVCAVAGLTLSAIPLTIEFKESESHAAPLLTRAAQAVSLAQAAPGRHKVEFY